MINLALNAEELATILAALRYYQGNGMCDPDMRSDEIHEIATDGGELTSLDHNDVDALCDRLNGGDGEG